MHLSNLTLWQVELWPWYAFVVVWLVASLWVKSSKITEPLESRLAHGALFAGGFYLLFSRSLEFGLLKLRFVPPLHWVQITGVVLTFAGSALAIWARLILGESWSARVTRKVGHELIRTGPYAFVRHPIYSGLLLAVIGTALVVGEARALLAIPIVLAGQAVKARREEQFMLQEFGEGYEQYRRETGFLLPRF
jgi:protein-S-isoprenylcysteine O-methyltransferase Ste14